MLHCVMTDSEKFLFTIKNGDIFYEFTGSDGMPAFVR